MVIKILGSGCANCNKLAELAQKAAEELDFEAEIEKITDMEIIMGYGILSTPALVVDEQIVSYGYVPSLKDLKEILVGSNKNFKSKNIGCSCGGKC